MIKAAAKKAEARKKIKECMANVKARKKSIKEELKMHKKLTKSMKKSQHLAPSSLDAFSESSMYYTEKEVNDYLAGSTIMENYHATKNDWD